ncbi:MAG: hypothetical protein ACOY3Y_14765 [Acidobacteriota bacterium]
MARQNYAQGKRLREIAKKQKREEKAQRRAERKAERGETGADTATPPTEVRQES